MLAPAIFVKLIFRNFGWNDNVKSSFWIVGTSWMGWGRPRWDWHMGMSYLTFLNSQLFKNIAYVGSFKHFFLFHLFFTCRYFTTWPRPALTAVSLVQCVTCVVCHCNWKTRELNVSVTFALITAGLGLEQLMPPPSMRESYRTHLILGSEDLFSVYLTQRELRISNYFEKQKN